MERLRPAWTYGAISIVQRRLKGRQDRVAAWPELTAHEDERQLNLRIYPFLQTGLGIGFFGVAGYKLGPALS